MKRWKKNQSLLLAAGCCFVVVVGIAFQIGNKIAPNRLALNVKSQTRLGLLTSAFSVRGTTDTPVSCLQGRTKKKRSRMQLGTVVHSRVRCLSVCFCPVLRWAFQKSIGMGKKKKKKVITIERRRSASGSSMDAHTMNVMRIGWKSCAQADRWAEEMKDWMCWLGANRQRKWDTREDKLLEVVASQLSC